LAGTEASGRAVVLGASVGGLLAARVLSETFERVTVFDRDKLPTGAANRRGVPQGEHPHGLLARGWEVLERLFPGLTDEITARGGVPVDAQRDIAWVYGDLPVPRAATGLTGVCVSRPALEAAVRSRVMALPNVTVLDRHEATGLMFDGVRVTGATVLPAGGTGREVPAELVVDATGRGNRGPTWLAALGFERPHEDVVDPLTTYMSRTYRRVPGRQDFAAIVVGSQPHRPQGGVAMAVEDDRWMVMLVGIGTGEAPPPEPHRYAEYAARFPDQRLHQLLSTSEPLGPPLKARLPPSVRRRYERLARLPDGFLAFGDAICSFNPVYGQGMTVAAMEAVVLRDCLRRGRHNLPRRFFARAARVVDVAWNMAIGADLANPAVRGVRTRRTRLISAYVGKVQYATARDAKVAHRFLRVANLMLTPTALFAPGFVARVLWLSRTARATASQPDPAPVG
jgi:2-polyprenyl-6-methoxyphenol hydroxylase-like FAD-dependent oxidoreductase